MKYYETYEDSKYLYLVMEFCPGGELFEKIAEKNTFSEREASVIMYDIMLAIRHCHQLNIAHRDIKPENLMYGQDGHIKLIDFGLAKQTAKKKHLMSTLAGTPYFIAPEVLQGTYGRECDIWSLGVLLFMLLSGDYPFDGDSKAEVFEKIKSGKFEFNRSSWKKISKEAKKLISLMICKDWHSRINAGEALNHKWFKRFRDQSSKDDTYQLDASVVHNLREFKGQSRLKKAAMNVLVKMLKPKEIEHLRREFMKIDTDHSGIIEFKELEAALKSAAMRLPADEIDQIIGELDYDGNKMINYSEFLAATISVKTILTHEKLEALFQQFDVEGQDQITKENIRDAFKSLGQDITLEEIEEIMAKHDGSGDGIIQFGEFKKMMLDEDS